MGEFTVTSETLKLDEFDEKLVVTKLQDILIDMANKREEELQKKINSLYCKKSIYLTVFFWTSTIGGGDMKKLRKIFTLVLIAIMFITCLYVDNVDSSTSKNIILDAKAQAMLNSNSK